MIRCPPVLVLLACAACTPSPPRDPLDPSVLDDLGQEQGDAQGIAWSGSYAAHLERKSCDCPPFSIGEDAADPGDVALCTMAELESGDDLWEITQADGMLSVEAFAEMTGPINEDGAFGVTGVYDHSSAIYALRMLSRLDGTLSQSGTSTTLDGVLQQRWLGTVGEEPVDCRLVYDASATREQAARAIW